ncbi:MAG TPA: tetratricopeptide repeat protein [Thermoanaerobaculia bacterium]|jgi:tetratricopeptide (TPR) repeat protein|nr:tetratricopeptide repeat protein [Thermoanaerobaculia bacterium]
MSTRILRRPLLLAALLAAAACVQYQDFDSAGHLRQQFSERVGPERSASIEIPYEITPELRAALEQRLRQAPSERSKINEVLRFIFEDLDLNYSLTPTRNAVQTYETKKGNCLSFVNLFVGVARELGLNPFYVEVTDYQKWNHREGMVVSQGHIVGGMYLEGELKPYDFLPYRAKAYRDFKPIDDLTAVAHYYNNLGAEALMAGDLPTALRHLEVATAIAPKFEKGLNNMGVALARSGQYDKALEWYQKGLEIDPENPMILTNLTRLYQQTGRAKEADELLARLEASNESNPFFFVYQGEMALSRGENEKAIAYMVRALRQDSELPEVHVGFVKVYVALGDLEKARHHLERALKLDATNQDALAYARLIGQ